MYASKEKYIPLTMKTPYLLHLDNNEQTTIYGIGTIRISTENENSAKLENVIYEPGLRSK